MRAATGGEVGDGDRGEYLSVRGGRRAHVTVNSQEHVMIRNIMGRSIHRGRRGRGEPGREGTTWSPRRVGGLDSSSVGSPVSESGLCEGGCQRGPLSSDPVSNCYSSSVAVLVHRSRHAGLEQPELQLAIQVVGLLLLV